MPSSRTLARLRRRARVLSSHTATTQPPPSPSPPPPSPPSATVSERALRTGRRATATTTAASTTATTTTTTATMSSPAGVQTSSAPLKPIYIYPGLLRVVRQKAITLDSRCPATVYKCLQCRDAKESSSAGDTAAKETSQGPTITSTKNASDCAKTASMECTHSHACAICLEDFHTKDLVRRMPCNAAHVFHTRCILSWFRSHDRCPLCNEPVAGVSGTAAGGTTAAARPGRPRPAPLPRTRGESAPRSQTRLSRPSPDVTSSPLPPPPPAPRTEILNLPMNAARIAPRRYAQESMSMRDLRRAEVLHGAREFQSGPLPRRKRPSGPRTYSYIVHDSVRMELDL